ncbi:MAG: phosphate butyryltransferase [Prevotella sp.]|nr:phosphate butyryltransferase [Prevotella sp.]MBQ9646535.1 phosphate butyryltransferase [Prevotella sp.]
MKTIKNFDELVAHLTERTERRRVAVVCGRDESTREAVARAEAAGFVEPIMVDDDDVDVAAARAVALVREGKADVLMKGLLNTDNLLKAVLNKETGILPQGRVLTHLTCAQLPQMDRLLFVTDVAVIPYPTKEQRAEQLRYLLNLCRAMGIEEPRVSLINCSEKVNAKHFPFTVEYQELIAQTRAGEFGPCIVDGPLDLKTSLSAHALHKKGIESPLEGQADGLIFPDIQAGNVFYKTITLFCGAETAAILQGPQVPVVLTSRADSVESKFYSLALAAI